MIFMKMSDLLDKYSDCDTFSLTKMAVDEKLSDDELNGAQEEIIKYNYDTLKKLHSKFEGLKEFDSLYNEVREEVSHFASKHSYKLLKEVGCFENSFICDFVGVDTKYSEPSEFFWHLYHSLGFNLDCKVVCSDYYGEKDILDDIDNLLKDSCIKYKVGFVTHCTVTGSLQITYFFKLNEKTKEYLLKYNDIFDLYDLEDLALYKDGKMMASTCTHECYFDEY